MNPIDLESPILRSEELPYEEFAYPIVSRRFLPEPDPPPASLFFEVLDRRRSQRTFKSLSFDQLNMLLWHSARTINIAPKQNPIRWEHRPSPSGGGRHPVDVFILNRRVADNKVLLYQTIPHAIATLRVEEKALKNLLTKTAEILPPRDATIIWFGAQFQRTLSRYQNGDSIVWKDAGALTATFTFVAEALELNSCPIGITGEPYFSQCFQTEKLIGVGGIYVGNR